MDTTVRRLEEVDVELERPAVREEAARREEVEETALLPLREPRRGDGEAAAAVAAPTTPPDGKTQTDDATGQKAPHSPGGPHCATPHRPCAQLRPAGQGLEAEHEASSLVGAPEADAVPCSSARRVVSVGPPATSEGWTRPRRVAAEVEVGVVVRRARRRRSSGRRVLGRRRRCLVCGAAAAVTGVTISLCFRACVHARVCVLGAPARARRKEALAAARVVAVCFC